jgi:hypothetical protein
VKPPCGLTVYYEGDSFYIPLSKRLKSPVEEQLKDNKGALYTRLNSVALQVSGSSSYAIDRINLRNDLVAILCDCLRIPPSAITDNFGLSHEELMEVYHAEPISLFSCLECRDPLPEGSLRVLRRRKHALCQLSGLEIGDLVDLCTFQNLLCGTCYLDLRSAAEDRLRELRTMPYPMYLLTREWNDKRERTLMRAEYQCYIFTRPQRLEVHHRSYERRGHELLEDLAVLCRICHQNHHNNLPKAA